MPKEQTRKVSLPGHGVFWFLEDSDGSGPLAPLDHCDEGGEMVDLRVALLGESYAHVFEDGTIKRYSRVIGHRDDLQPAEKEPADV